MDIESADLHREECAIEENRASVAEQPQEEVIPQTEPVNEHLEPCGQTATERSVPDPEPPVWVAPDMHTFRSRENETPCGRREPDRVKTGDPYGGVPHGTYGYTPNSNPYQQGYYRPTAYGAGYPQTQAPYYGGNYVPLIREAAYTSSTPYAPPKPVVRKNNKPVCALILGILAMGILNFMPFVALILSVIAVCTGYTGLKQGELTKGKQICGFIGLGLGIVGLILSVTMLTMLLSLSVRAAKEMSDSANGIFR